MFQIIPFAPKGADDVYSILLDGKDVMASPLGSLFEKTGLTKYLRDGEMIPPVVRGVDPTIIPRPERFFFAFGEPIETGRFNGKYEDQETLREVRREVENALKTQIEILLFLLDQNKDYSFWRRLLTRL